ncbi:hypothetical protein L6164_005627 [Bauhinia variegata]|uniref:Uncharacterized protein n=1 Tax=Bauhinia variegata TaxID=167791 RepID=A0ACB9PRX0_BAUVA|nr:hypothetical protein L6164_005627 [Bauhinia variegata]
MSVAMNDNSGIFFIYGYGGIGKTFLYRTLSAVIQSKEDIMPAVASSVIVSLLLPGGRTAHSRFCIPLNVNEHTYCNIKPSHLDELLAAIWDGAPIVHKYCFGALDISLKDVLRSYNTQSANLPFEEKVVVLGGDFRQILPVIPYGMRQDI